LLGILCLKLRATLCASLQGKPAGENVKNFIEIVLKLKNKVQKLQNGHQYLKETRIPASYTRMDKCGDAPNSFTAAQYAYQHRHQPTWPWLMAAPTNAPVANVVA